MDDKVRRGLGLLAVAGLGLVIVVVCNLMTGDAEQFGETVGLGGVLLLAVGLIGGLVNIAIGLLRPSHN